MILQRVIGVLFLIIIFSNLQAQELEAFKDNNTTILSKDSNATVSSSDENSTEQIEPKKISKVVKVKQFVFENDFIAGTDEHYTNGIYFSWLNDKNIYIPEILDFGSDKKSKAFTISHLMFTPQDLSTKEKINTDIPYAGYAGLEYKTFQYSSNYFHEIGSSIGFTGKYTYAKEFQIKLHDITGNTIPQGWNNQLGSHLLLGVSYQYGAKTDKLDLGLFDMDLTGSLKFTVGELYTGSRVGWVVRAGNKLMDNFHTTGDFLGGLESSLINYKKLKGFFWVFSYGGFVNKLNHFYIMEQSDAYEVETIDYVSGDFVALSLGYNSFSVTFHIKRNHLNGFELNEYDFELDDLIEYDKTTEYGGVILTWEF